MIAEEPVWNCLEQASPLAQLPQAMDCDDCFGLTAAEKESCVQLEVWPAICPRIPMLPSVGAAVPMKCPDLSVYMDSLEHSSTRIAFLTRLRELVSQRRYIAPSELWQYISYTLALKNAAFATHVGELLYQDLGIRAYSNFCPDSLWEVLQEALAALQDSSSPFQCAKTCITYLTTLLVKELNSAIGSKSQPLLERVLSLSSKWERVQKVLRVLFLLLQSGRGADVAEALVTLVSLLLLTCGEGERAGLAHKLALELSQKMRLSLRSRELCQKFLLMVPSHYLREQVIDMYLEKRFRLPSPLSFSARELRDAPTSLCKICCVHFLRVPEEEGDLEHLLTLLSSLLHSHLNRLQGCPLLTCQYPLRAHTHTPTNTSSSSSSTSSSPLLQSFRPHVQDLINTHATQASPHCWVLLQMINAIVD